MKIILKESIIIVEIINLQITFNRYITCKIIINHNSLTSDLHFTYIYLLNMYYLLFLI